MNEQAFQNTDVELWRKDPNDFYSPSIHVTQNGNVGINVGGLVLVAPIEAWFKAGAAAFRIVIDGEKGCPA